MEGVDSGRGAGGMSPLRGPPADATQLEFHQAMKDFQTMFPDMDPDVIEAVLRANNGTVDATIDQLLAMSTDVENERLRSQLEAQEPLAVGSSAAIGGSRPSLQQSAYQSPVRSATSRTQESNHSKDALRDIKNWKPPLLGPLPISFLRLDSTGSAVASGGGVPSGPGSESGNPGDAELAQFLEDERMAIFLQNEEFMRELRRNKDFMSSLDSGQGGGHKGDDSQAHMHDDAAFRERLKSMGKMSKRKFAQMARLFQRTGALASASKSGGKFKHMNPMPSRDKLLLGDETTSDGEEPETPKQKNPL